MHVSVHGSGTTWQFDLIMSSAYLHRFCYLLN